MMKHPLLERCLWWVVLLALAVMEGFSLFMFGMAEAYFRFESESDASLVSFSVSLGTIAFWLSPVVLVLYWCSVPPAFKKWLTLLWVGCVLLTQCGWLGMR